MTPTKRRPATPAGQGPTRTAPDVPIVANPPPVPPAKSKDGPRLLGPEGKKVVSREAPRGDGDGDSAPPTRTGQVDAGDRATTQSPRRPLSLYPLPVWPD
jgi:hypothetical protein